MRKTILSYFFKNSNIEFINAFRLKPKYFIIILLTFMFKMGTSQVLVLKNDTFYFNDSNINYTINPTFNDSIEGLYDITKVDTVLNGGLFTAIILDSTRIRILDNNSVQYTGMLRYFIKLRSTGKTDSATVLFFKNKLANDIYPGDGNLDRIVNHLDVLSLGVHYNSIGTPRNNFENSVVFLPRMSGNWNSSFGNINAKYSDYDGSGKVDSMDMIALDSNYNKTWGTPSVSLSPSSNSTFLNVQRANPSLKIDTLYYDPSVTNTLKIPIKLESTSPINSYGIGYSYKLFLDSGASRVAYIQNNVFTPTNSSWLNSSNSLKYMKYNNTGTNDVAICRRDHTNVSGNGELGIVEIVVVEVLIGLTEPNSRRLMTLEMSDVAFIDNQYNMIPITPVIYHFIAKNGTKPSSINSISKQEMSVFPTLATDVINIVSPSIQPLEISIYNVLGSEVKNITIVNQKSTQLDIHSLQKGVYFLRVNDTNYKFIKE